MDLLRNYPAGYNVLPTANPHDVVNITLQLALYHIVDMNERAQTLTTNCEIITKWHDVFLMWDPARSLPEPACTSLHLPAPPCTSLHLPAPPCTSLHLPAPPC